MSIEYVTIEKNTAYRILRDPNFRIALNDPVSFPFHLDADYAKYWCLADGLVHREDGPAKIISTGSEYWFSNGILHRRCGPAVINHLNKIVRWVADGVTRPFEKHCQYLNLSDEDIMIQKIKWCEYKDVHDIFIVT